MLPEYWVSRDKSDSTLFGYNQLIGFVLLFLTKCFQVMYHTYMNLLVYILLFAKDKSKIIFILNMFRLFLAQSLPVQIEL